METGSSNLHINGDRQGIVGGENGGKEALPFSGNAIPETEKISSLSSEEDDINPHFRTENGILQPYFLKSQPNGSGEDTGLDLREDPAGERRKLAGNKPEEFGGNLPSLTKYIRECRSGLSSNLRKFLHKIEGDNEEQVESLKQNFQRPKSLISCSLEGKYEDELCQQFRGRITVFSRSGCRECRAVRSYFRERRLPFVDINIDVYPLRKFEVEERTGSAFVPQIFFNDQVLGGIVALNALHNSGQFDHKLQQVIENKCPATAPLPPVYGVDDEDHAEVDELIDFVRIIRMKLPIQDRLFKMHLYKNCFTGTDVVELLIDELDCGRRKAVEMAKGIARKHFFHHVLQENTFEDGNHLYRFLEHDPVISAKCFNFRGFPNDEEPKPAALIVDRLWKISTAILETYVSDDGRHVNYRAISMSEEFRRYVNLIQDLQRLDMLTLTRAERLAFFLNIYNTMVIHAIIKQGHPDGLLERRKFFGEFQYVIGGYPYSLSAIHNGILRANQRPPYGLRRPFKAGDGRAEVALEEANPLTHFGLCNGSNSSPRIRFYSPEGVDVELRSATRAFFEGDGISVDIQTRTIYLSKIFKWFSVDFGDLNDMLNWIMFYLDASKAGLLSHMQSTNGPIDVVYQNYDWSLNS